MARRYSYDEVKSEVEEQGFILLSDSYKNSSTKLDMLCPEGHPISITFNGWKYRKGNGCKVCQRDQQSLRTRLSRGFVSDELVKEGYTLISNYLGSSTPFTFVCPEGHTSTITWDNWKRGCRCKVCANNVRLSLGFIRKSFSKEGYELISKRYVNAHTKLKVRCNNGHTYMVSWNKWSRGRRCPICSRRITVSDVQDVIDQRNEDFICIGVDYPDKLEESVIRIKCSEGHIFDVSKRTWWATHRCPICDRFTSSIEKDILNFLEGLGFKCKQQDRKLIYPYEIDILIPELKAGIEINGLYWHSEKGGGKGKDYHLSKLEMCETKGYRLITLFEDEIREKKDILLSRLRNILGKRAGFKIYARDCVIKEISYKEAVSFLASFHIQGRGNSSIRLGAFYGDVLVAVMTFSKRNLAKKQQGVELDRYATHHSFCIPGVASKLLLHFERNYGWKSIVSFADRRWSQGNLYAQLGFTYAYSTRPNYWYLDKFYLKRIGRFGMRKNKKDAPSLTEWENRQLQGYDRIWDCGNLKYIKYNKEYSSG